MHKYIYQCACKKNVKRTCSYVCVCIYIYAFPVEIASDSVVDLYVYVYICGHKLARAARVSRHVRSLCLSYIYMEHTKNSGSCV